VGSCRKFGQNGLPDIYGSCRLAQVRNHFTVFIYESFTFKFSLVLYTAYTSGLPVLHSGILNNSHIQCHVMYCNVIGEHC